MEGYSSNVASHAHRPVCWFVDSSGGGSDHWVLLGRNFARQELLLQAIGIVEGYMALDYVDVEC